MYIAAQLTLLRGIEDVTNQIRIVSSLQMTESHSVLVPGITIYLATTLATDEWNINCMYLNKNEVCS